MIREYVTDLAVQKGIELSEVRLVEGRTVGCLDVHLLHLVTDSHKDSVLVYQSELDALQHGSCTQRLHTKLDTALSRLQKLLES